MMSGLDADGPLIVHTLADTLGVKTGGFASVVRPKRLRDFVHFIANIILTKHSYPMAPADLCVILNTTKCSRAISLSK
jgi:hypothetical protein